MTINKLTPEDFTELVRSVIQDETTGLAKEESVDTLQTSVDALTAKIDSYLNLEWNVHLHQKHPWLETRIAAIEKRLSIKPPAPPTPVNERYG